jgi:hypothetical protein
MIAENERLIAAAETELGTSSSVPELASGPSDEA